MIRGLSITADAAILGQSFQGAAAVRRLSQTDSASLATFAARQPVWYSAAEPVVARPLEPTKTFAPCSAQGTHRPSGRRAAPRSERPQVAARGWVDAGVGYDEDPVHGGNKTQLRIDWAPGIRTWDLPIMSPLL